MFDLDELERGAEVELEHTDDPVVARQIALDHLEEHPDYYRGLDVLEAILEDEALEELEEWWEERR